MKVKKMINTTLLSLAVMTCFNSAQAENKVIDPELLKLAETSPDAAWVVACTLYGCRGWNDETELLRALPYFEAAAEGGVPPSFTRLGQIYRKSKSPIPTDLKKSLSYFELGYKHGDPSASRELAFAYYKGRGVIEDPLKAYTWFLVAKAWGMKITSEIDTILTSLKRELSREELTLARAKAESLFQSIDPMDYDSSVIRELFEKY